MAESTTQHPASCQSSPVTSEASQTNKYFRPDPERHNLHTTWPLVEDHGDSAAGAGFCGISCVSFSVDISTTAQPGYLESLSLYVGALLYYEF